MLGSIFTTVLHMSFLASVIAVVAIVIRSLFKHKLPKSFFLCLWAIVFIKLITPFEISSPASLYNQINFGNNIEDVNVPDNTANTFDTTETAPIPQGDQNKSQALQEDNNKSQTVQVEQNKSQALQSEVNNDSETVQKSISFFSILAWIWLCGVILMLMGLCWLYRVNIKRFQKIHSIDDPYITEFIAKQKIKQKLVVGTLPNIHSPAVFGIFRPIIALPIDYNTYSNKELSYILMHEIQHIKRRDNLLNVCAILILCCHWFNPLIWLSYKFYNHDVELARDRQVLHNLDDKEKLNYADMILCMGNNKPQLDLLFVAGFAEKPIKVRIKSIIRYKKTPLFTSIISSLLIGVMVMVFATSAISPVQVQGSNEKTIPPNGSNDSMADESNMDNSGNDQSSRDDNSDNENPINDDMSHEDNSDNDDSSQDGSSNDESSQDNSSDGLPIDGVSSSGASNNNKSKSDDFKAPPVMPESIEIIDKNKLTIEQGYVEYDYVSLGFTPVDYYGCSQTLTAVIYPSNAADKTVKWTSSNPDIVKVNRSGVITPRKEGIAYVTATTINGKTAKIKVSAYEFRTGCIPDIFPEKIEIMYNYELMVDDISLYFDGENLYSEKLTALITPLDTTMSDVTWSSSDPDVVEVSQDGVITPKKAGSSAIITVKTVHGDVEAHVKVNVYEAEPDVT